MNQSELIINPQDYNLTLLQLESISSEYLGKCLDVVFGDELHIEFDNFSNRVKFLEVINYSFRKKD